MHTASSTTSTSTAGAGRCHCLLLEPRFSFASESTGPTYLQHIPVLASDGSYGDPYRAHVQDQNGPDAHSIPETSIAYRFRDTVLRETGSGVRLAIRTDGRRGPEPLTTRKQEILYILMIRQSITSDELSSEGGMALNAAGGTAAVNGVSHFSSILSLR